MPAKNSQAQNAPSPEQKPGAPVATAPVVSVSLPVRGEHERFETILVRLSRRDKDAVRRMAGDAGLSLSAWCRAVIESVVRQAEGEGKA